MNKFLLAAFTVASLSVPVFLGIPAMPAHAAPDKSAQETVPLLRAMLTDYRRYAETLWHTAKDAPDLGYWGTGKSDGGNEGIRAVANTALVYALLAREGDIKFATSERVEPALHYAAAIHLTGGQKGTDGRSWGNSWQSAMWAGNLGVTAWLAGDKLSPETRTAVERVVTYEADRFTTIPPPTMTPGDTRAEENAWDLTAPSAALLLMPDHPHAREWHEAVLQYGFNTLSVAADESSTHIADGKPIRDWVTATQCFPDYTLENHGIFHPVYAMVAPVTMAQAAVAYRLGGKPVPDALKFNTLNGWQALRHITLPDGEWLYPQGLDWDLHDYEHLHYWTMLATLYHDPAAAQLEQRTAQQARRRQEINGDGSFVGPSGNLGFAREAVQAERVAFALLMHQQFGEPPAVSGDKLKRMLAALEPVRAFDYAGFVVHRTPRGLLSFSWKNHLMGLVAPQSDRYLDFPYVTTPNVESLVGRFRIENQSGANANKFTVNGKAVHTDKKGFGVAVDANVNAGRLHQQIAVVSLESGALVYLDRVTAASDVIITEARGLVVGIENDPVSGNRRSVYSGSGQALEIQGGVAGDHALMGAWANVDGKLGLITASPANGLLYRAVEKPNRAGAREDFLIGAFDAIPRTVKAGEIVAERAGLVLPNASPEETARLAAQLKVTRDATGTTLKFTAPDKRAYTLALSSDGTVRWQNHLLQPTQGNGTVVTPRRSAER